MIFFHFGFSLIHFLFLSLSVVLLLGFFFRILFINIYFFLLVPVVSHSLCVIYSSWLSGVVIRLFYIFFSIRKCENENGVVYCFTLRIQSQQFMCWLIQFSYRIEWEIYLRIGVMMVMPLHLHAFIIIDWTIKWNMAI